MGEPLAKAELEPAVDVPCTVCGSAEHRTVASADELDAERRWLRQFHRRRLRRATRDALEERADFTQDYATAIVACRRCGLVYRDPRPADDAITSAYSGDTYGEERLAALFESQLELFRPKARSLARRLDSPRPVVLEIGSFVGGFLAAARELGWDAHGIDPGVEVARFCEAKGLSVLRENASEVVFPACAADCVAIWNTFDQLPDPHPTLRSARRCLKNDGLLVVRVPNGVAFERGVERLRRAGRIGRRVLLTSMAWNNLLSFPYLHGYSVATLDLLVGGYGFAREHVDADVLTRLADGQTTAWGRAEERAFKVAQKLSFAFAPARAAGRAPWLDVYYRAGA
jgi:SAM-dependent methyltransferase